MAKKKEPEPDDRDDKFVGDGDEVRIMDPDGTILKLSDKDKRDGLKKGDRVSLEPTKEEDAEE